MHNASSTTTDSPLRNALLMFYVIDPKDTYFKDPGDVPDYITIAIPYFYLFFLIEIVSFKFGNYPEHYRVRFNDSTSSFIQGSLYLCLKAVVGGSTVPTYIWLYRKIHLVELPYDSLWTYIVSLVVIDFIYYWFHRATHEVNLFWAFHVTHHSAEDYNLSTALRQSAFQHYLSSAFNFLGCFIIPPPQMMVD
jgi:alkylglycerol monooxygenase